MSDNDQPIPWQFIKGDEQYDPWVPRPQLLADLAAAQAQVRRLRAVLTAALDDLEARDELSALDGLRAALATGEPAAEPSTEE